MLKRDDQASLLAEYYDELAYDMPYRLWLDVIDQFKEGRTSVLDIGCGTGMITRQLDFDDVQGLDISETMIRTAEERDGGIKYHVDDMETFRLDGQFDMITATVDVMNYLPSPESFLNTLKNIARHLNDDGVCIFDVHSIYKMNNDFMNMTYSDETEHLVYIWHAMRDEAPYSVIHDMTFFIKMDDDNHYSRHEESYTQRTYPHKEILQMIDETGLTVDVAFSDFDPDNAVTDVCDRIFYIVKKAS